MEHPLEGGKKVYINGSGHITELTAMPIHGKNLQTSSLTELMVLVSRNLEHVQLVLDKK